MAWTTPRTWVAGETLTFTLLNTHLRDNMLVQDVAQVAAAGDYIVSNGVNSLTSRQYDGGTLLISETKTGSTFGNLTTVGPVVTLTTGTSALIFMACEMSNATIDQHSKVSYRISGATTSASADTRSILRDGLPAANLMRVGTFDSRTDLTAGSNTFTMEYASDGAGTSTFNNRTLIVIPL